MKIKKKKLRERERSEHGEIKKKNERD